MKKLFLILAATLVVVVACNKQEVFPGSEDNTSIEFRNLTGAIYTTNATCDGVNVNLYDAKDDVYLNGGPQGGGSGLPDGNYYAKVTTPDGDMLGKTNIASVEVLNGSFVQCYQLVDILYSISSGSLDKGYDDTDNNGGVYKVWVSMYPDFPNNESKTDNFKVEANVTQQYDLRVEKFYDANANGSYDAGEVYIPDWKVNISDEFDYNEDIYTPTTVTLDAGSYTVSEYLPVQTNWKATTSTSVDVTLPPPTTVAFGNLCLGGGGGKTIGFWGNRNGQALVGADDIELLVELNLRNATGAHFNPANYAGFKSWLQSANATNMAYMLSAQMAAMSLNVYNGLVSGDALIYAPGANSANALGYATVNAIIAEANAELALNGLTTSGHPSRSYQEALKNALDNANNNLNFVQAGPCPFTFGE